jgi:hypothetical protein
MDLMAKSKAVEVEAQVPLARMLPISMWPVLAEMDLLGPMESPMQEAEVAQV